MNYEGLFDESAEKDFVYAVMDSLQAGAADGHQALSLVPVEALGFPMTRNWFKAMKNLVNGGTCPEFQLILGELRAMGIIKNTKELGEYSASFENIKYIGDPIPMGKRLVDLFHRREAVRVFSIAAEKAANPMENHQEIIYEAAREALDIMAGGDDAPTPCGDEIMERVASHERFAVDPNSAKLAYFGVGDLDEEIPASSGNLVIICARPGRGKTALVIQTLCETTADRPETFVGQYGPETEMIPGDKCLFISLELPKVEVHARLASWVTMHRSGAFWKGNYGPHEVSTLNDHRDHLNRVIVWAAPSRTPWSRIESKIRGAVLRHGIKMVCIDYFGLIGRPDPGKGSSVYNEAAKLSGQIRSLAQTLGICIVLLCQVNRDGAEGEPGMEDLRETGQLEQDAQTILALYGAKAKNGVDRAPWETQKEVSKVDEQDPTWIKVLKNRNGKAGFKFQLHFDGATNHFAKAEGHT